MIGTTISHYKILEKLGEGGMGVVYKAEDTTLDRLVALKFLPSQISVNEETKARFLQEARAAAALNHPNIAQIYSIEESGDTMFITMEFVDGKTLNEIGTRNLRPETVLRHASHIAAALQAAHSKGIIHRDIKSANIMVTGEGTVKIMDFGLAKMMTGPQVTKVGTTVGTAAYMSPEQVQGKDADQRSDIWSFGAVLYEMVSGQLPFGGTYEQAVFYSILNQPPLSIPEGIPRIPSLSRVTDKCLEKDPSKRYQSFSEVLTDLHASTTTAAHVSGAALIQPHAGRKAFAAMASLLLIVLAVLFVGPGNIRHWLGFESIPEEQHLAVLPFTSIGGDSTKQPLCDGLVETITSKLTQLEQFHGSLWVVPSSEVRRNKTQSPGEAYQSFGANLVITGNLQLVEDVFRLTLNLIDARNLRQLSSSVLDIRQASIAGLQDQSVTRLLEMLNLELSPRSQDVITAGATTIADANEEYLLGLGYLQRYDVASHLDTAIKHFQYSIERDTGFALAYAGLGEAYWRKYETTKNPALVEPALTNCKKAYELNPKLPEVSIALGLIHWGTGENEKALQDFNTALELSPGNDAVYRGLARIYEAAGNLAEAEATYKRAIQLKPSYWASHNELGVFYYRKGRYQEAAEQFLNVTRLTPDNARAYSNAGGIYYMLKRWPEAQEMFERSIAIKKTYAACSNLATLYYVQGNFTEAAGMYEEALRINDQDYRIWGNLGAAYHWAPGAREKATPAFQKAIQEGEQALTVNPKDAETISRLSGYYAMIGEKEKALSLIDRAVRIDPANTSVLYTVGTTFEQLGNREKALLYIVRAIEGGYSLHEVEQQPELKQLVADPRFAELRKKAPSE